jgi:hypothetical protein
MNKDLQEPLYKECRGKTLDSRIKSAPFSYRYFSIRSYKSNSFEEMEIKRQLEEELYYTTI